MVRVLVWHHGKLRILTYLLAGQIEIESSSKENNCESRPRNEIRVSSCK